MEKSSVNCDVNSLIICFHSSFLEHSGIYMFQPNTFYSSYKMCTAANVDRLRMSSKDVVIGPLIYQLSKKPVLGGGA